MMQNLFEASMVEFDKKVVGGVKLPRTLILSRAPVKAELGEPLRHGIHLFTDRDTEEITAVEIVDLERL
jgi:hypothetical protein